MLTYINNNYSLYKDRRSGSASDVLSPACQRWQTRWWNYRQHHEKPQHLGKLPNPPWSPETPPPCPEHRRGRLPRFAGSVWDHLASPRLIPNKHLRGTQSTRIYQSAPAASKTATNTTQRKATPTKPSRTDIQME